MSLVLFEKKDNVGILTVNRPEALNALNAEVVKQLQATLAEVAVSGVRCLIVTGAGEKSFVAGADISEMAAMSPQEARQLCVEGNKVMEAMEQLPMPTIAAVNGFALGGGCELALSCDIRIASEKASFSLPETSLGILPGYGGLQRLARLINPAKAKELAFTTRRIKADEALAIGLVNAVAPPEGLMDAAMEMAGQIAANAPIGVAGAKKVINESFGMTLAEATRLEADAFSACFGTDDQREAMQAFVEKRKPAPFTGK